MNTVNLTEAQYVLRKTLALHGQDLTLRHTWVWEVDRWKELVFALLVQVSSAHEDRVREIVGNLADVGLLDIPPLAGICTDGKQPNLDRPLAQQILDFLQESGLSHAVAERGLTAICQAALAFQTNYGGRVQRYLRRYGEVMLNDLERIFQFSGLTKEEMRHVFTYWFQNVLNLPLSLTDENLQKYCEAYHLTPVQLGEAADELNLNQALLDDLAALWVKSHSKDIQTS